MSTLWPVGLSCENVVWNGGARGARSWRFPDNKQKAYHLAYLLALIYNSANDDMLEAGTLDIKVDRDTSSRVRKLYIFRENIFTALRVLQPVSS